jgi:hypothetical protein
MLYEDDMCHPLNQECEPVLSKNETNKKVKKIMSDIYQNNKGFHLIKRQSFKDGKTKTHNVEVFSSGCQGNTIRNAIGGSYYYGHKVGSKYEDFYYKVGISTGDVGRDTISLFYDSPEQYERHMYTVVDSENKERWLEKQMRVKMTK